MTSSPAWLTIALTSLASSSSSSSPSPRTVLSSGIRKIPSPHILHHLNRWARHVWRPAVTSRALAALTRDPDTEQISALGSGAVSLLSALVEAIERCEAEEWIGVLGVLFLADDPWVIEVGRAEGAKDVDRAAAAMNILYESKRNVLADVASKLSLDVTEVPYDIDADSSLHGESFAELRCRVAALQLQLDDVTAVVRRNEKNTKDLLSSFHFWSMLLLDELRSYKAQLSEKSNAPAGAVAQNGSFGGPSKSYDVLETIPRSITGAFYRIGGSAGTLSDRSSSSEMPSNGSATPVSANAPKQATEATRPKRVFRDGKWIIL